MDSEPSDGCPDHQSGSQKIRAIETINHTIFTASDDSFFVLIFICFNQWDLIVRNPLLGHLQLALYKLF